MALAGRAFSGEGRATTMASATPKPARAGPITVQICTPVIGLPSR